MVPFRLVVSFSVDQHVVEDDALQRQAQQGLQDPLRLRGVRQVSSSGHECDSLKRVVHYDTQVIARRQVFSSHDDVAELMRIDGSLAVLTVKP